MRRAEAASAGRGRWKAAAAAGVAGLCEEEEDWGEQLEVARDWSAVCWLRSVRSIEERERGAMVKGCGVARGSRDVAACEEERKKGRTGVAGRRREEKRKKEEKKKERKRKKRKKREERKRKRKRK